MKDSPCKNCEERFTACSDKCPKDARGAYGYMAWIADVHKEEEEKKQWRKLMREDFARDARYEFITKKRRY